MLSLVDAADRDAYLRNARRFESAVQYAASSASLARWDPSLPTFAQGAYVPRSACEWHEYGLRATDQNKTKASVTSHDSISDQTRSKTLEVAAAERHAAANRPHGKRKRL